MAQLFRTHADLLEEFTYFLPDSTPPAPPVQHATLPQMLALLHTDVTCGDRHLSNSSDCLILRTRSPSGRWDAANPTGVLHWRRRTGLPTGAVATVAERRRPRMVRLQLSLLYCWLM